MEEVQTSLDFWDGAIGMAISEVPDVPCSDE
jgi:hypothetical protein